MYLVTGANSGLGKFLKRELDAFSFTRESSIDSFIKTPMKPFDAIIHCAFNSTRDVNAHTLDKYVDDNLAILQRLTRIPHRKFIFISSGDVYPADKQDVSWSEEDNFSITHTTSLYGICKMMAESIIKSLTDDYLILRSTAMLGKDARMNSLMKMLLEESPKLTLSSGSKFNYILHQDLLAFIQIAMQKNLKGTFNLAANTNVCLSEVADYFAVKPRFGEHLYLTAQMSNNKAKLFCGEFSRSSIENIERFLAYEKSV